MLKGYVLWPFLSEEMICICISLSYEGLHTPVVTEEFGESVMSEYFHFSSLFNRNPLPTSRD